MKMKSSVEQSCQTEFRRRFQWYENSYGRHRFDEFLEKRYFQFETAEKIFLYVLAVQMRRILHR